MAASAGWLHLVFNRRNDACAMTSSTPGAQHLRSAVSLFNNTTPCETSELLALRDAAHAGVD